MDADRDHLRIVRIKNTVRLSKIWISEAMLDEAARDPSIRILTAPMEMSFDSQGNFCGPFKDWM